MDFLIQTTVFQIVRKILWITVDNFQHLWKSRLDFFDSIFCLNGQEYFAPNRCF